MNTEKENLRASLADRAAMRGGVKDRREFIKTMAQAAAVGTAGVAGPGHAGPLPTITVAGVGDLIISRRVSDRRDEPFLAAIELLRGADCTWGNSEAVLAERRH